MSIRRGFRSCAVVALLLLISAASLADANPPPDPSQDRPPTVVVVREGGFRWTDAGVGAAAAIATTLLAVGLVLALRPDRARNGTP